MKRYRHHFYRTAVHLSTFNPLPSSSFMAASFPSASCPVGPQCLSQFLLDPQVWALTWFIDAVCDTNNPRQAGWQQGNFWLLLLLQGLLEDTSVSAHLFLSVSKDNVFKEESRGLSAQTSQAEQKFHLPPSASCLCFCCSFACIVTSFCLSWIHCLYTGDASTRRSGSQR